MEWRAASQVWADEVALLFCDTDANGRITACAKPLAFDALFMHATEPGTILDATIRMQAREAQSLINALWQAGIRPHDYANPNGELARMEAHLNDMRHIAFKGKPPATS
jgi:hypothetical protein